MTVFFATGNRHKAAELQAILGCEVKIPADLGLSFDPEETGSAFLDNALIKGRALWELVKQPVIADDSGLCVDALGGRPGILSARYGEETNGGRKLADAERNALLLKELEGETNRAARFVCAMVLYLGADRFNAAQETLEGEIALSPGGAGGFGYDPLLFLSDHGCTVAELPSEEKNRVSHRGKAARAVAKFLENL
jgi:XTP/dITP diphosphohydrolase